MNVAAHTIGASAVNMLSCFAGVGGLDLGVRLALPGARTVCLIEREFAACEILAARMADGSLDDAPIFTDITGFDGIPWRGVVDLCIGGFPCPDYSVAGKRAGIVGKHGQLWDSMRRVIGEVRPRFCFLENVPGILVPHGDDGPNAGIGYVLGDLAALGFDAEWLTLRASDVGAPHRRERWFCLAYRRSERRRCDAVADTGCAGKRRPTESAGIDRRGASGNDCGTSRESLDDAERSERWPKRGCGDGSEQGQHARGEADGGDREPDEVLGDALSTGLEVRRGQSGDDGTERTPAERAGVPLDLPDAERIDGDDSGHGTGAIRGQRRQTPEVLGLFPPGPSDRAGWTAALRERPWLAPAISEKEAECLLRGEPDGPDSQLDFGGHTDRLRALGNMVVPQQAALALLTLAQRAGVTP